MTFQQAVEFATAKLSAISESAKLDAQLLICHACNIEQTQLIAHPEQELNEQQIEEFKLFLNRRVKGEPLAYITGTKEFWSLDFKVNEHVLIPRPETELLVEQTLLAIQDKPSARILDLGTGSGTIAISVAKHHPDCHIVATDVSRSALVIAKQNAQIHETMINFICSNWFENIEENEFDVIVSNPPYIAKNDSNLDKFVSFYEPDEALISKHDGLSDLNLIITQARKFLSPFGALIVEHGYQQGESVRNLFTNAKFCNVKTHLDIAGLERCTSGST